MLIADHHLLPVLADWSGPVRFALIWDTEIDASLRGHEVRGAMRQWPRPMLTFTADVNGASKYHDLRAQLAATLRVDHIVPENTEGRTGRVCVPWAGRESWPSPAAVNYQPFSNMLELEAAHHPWRANDWLIAFNANETTWSVGQVASVAGIAADGQTLTLTAPLGFPITSDTAITPLFFGSLKSLPADLSHDSPALATMELSIVGDSYEPDPWPPAGEPEPPELPFASYDYAVNCMEIEFAAGTSQAGFGTTLLGYEWDFGDGDKGEGMNIVHTYLHPGSYLVTLTVRDNLGRRAQNSQLMTPVDCGDVSVGPDVPPPGNPPPGNPDGDPPDPPAPPPEPPPDNPPLPPPTTPLPPEDYPNPPYPDYPSSSGEPIAPPGFGL